MQIKQRVAGEKITDRLISLSDPDARPIRKGKLGKPNEFGYVAQIAEITPNTKRGARGLILPAASLPGNPGENALLLHSAGRARSEQLRRGPADSPPRGRGLADLGLHRSRSPAGGTGVLDLARAIREDRPHRASGALAAHVLDIMVGAIDAAEHHQVVTLTSNVEPAELLPDDWDPHSPRCSRTAVRFPHVHHRDSGHPDGGVARGLGVELNALNTIAEAERKGKPRDLFWPWFAANVSVFGISYGAFLLGFGISFGQAVVGRADRHRDLVRSLRHRLAGRQARLGADHGAQPGGLRGERQPAARRCCPGCSPWAGRRCWPRWPCWPPPPCFTELGLGGGRAPSWSPW